MISTLLGKYSADLVKTVGDNTYLLILHIREVDQVMVIIVSSFHLRSG